MSGDEGVTYPPFGKGVEVRRVELKLVFLPERVVDEATPVITELVREEEEDVGSGCGERNHSEQRDHEGRHQTVLPKMKEDERRWSKVLSIPLSISDN